ncbi:hypothetical protein CH278_23765 [Rhodococcus sp. 05-2254-5]|uniref:hypothetical protein n=2 Tax=Mycobacteriales TaxID=85007 RepID=UPI00050CE0BB|nr:MULTISPECIES: hypothetical protein [unclassified Rhodococcus (in: high G+C Gram-positive bacteria)]OZC56420.1 hypothetical protein CH267_10690 [Rhodococcus sp. 06-621-2]OZD55862.1 hypothetical protein CH266_00620 [Rhodococcus sp. 06-1474-1B]OZE28441.1 hypothetical protein CH278_23765 [Rhodococcus sp. 05-2254-5]OZE57064.1 hypothetical protein CH269_13895 [Rhodococcus sp. 05-2254-1]OZE72223.1 hypothetical protein CH305_28555 [Rhodococcus sp. 15-649-2-2]
MTNAHPQPSTSHPFDERCVLNGRPVRPETELSRASRFVDDVWDLSPAFFQQHHVALILDFTSVPSVYRTVAKELFIGLLGGPAPARGRGLPKVATIASMLPTLRHFFSWLASRPNLRQPLLSELQPSDLIAYQMHLLATQPTLTVRDRYRSSVRSLYRYRGLMVTDQLTFDPYHIDGWSESGDRSGPDNATARIPEAVLGPLLTWSLRFVDEFASDILAADREWRRVRLGQGSIPPKTRRWVKEELDQLIAEYRAADRPLPGHNGQPSIRHLSRMLGCDRTTLRTYRHLIEDTARLVGVDNDVSCDVVINGRINGSPWIDRILFNRRDRQAGILHLLSALSAACYVIIAFLSGMRDSEIKHLQRGCISVKRDPHGRPYRWMMTSLAFKGERDPTGVQVTWVVGAPAARAVAVLELLQPGNETRLFAPSTHGTAVRIGKTAAHVNLTKTTNDHINNLVSWIDGYCRAHGLAENIPAVNAQTWRLTTRQFRRTLAWFIARQPGGSIAGAIQYRHQAVQMFEGYAGTSDSGFRAEVESEVALARGEGLMAMIDTHEHTDLVGPAADEARRRLSELESNIRYQGQVVTDRRRHDRLIRRFDPAIYPGRYATCVYDPDKALCTRAQNLSGQNAPTLGDCRPLECRNVALTSGNLDELRSESSDIERELERTPSLPPLLQHRLRQRSEQINQFVDRHDPNSIR